MENDKREEEIGREREINRESRIYRRPLDIVNMKNTVVLLTVSASTPSSELKKLENFYRILNKYRRSTKLTKNKTN